MGRRPGRGVFEVKGPLYCTAMKWDVVVWVVVGVVDGVVVGEEDVGESVGGSVGRDVGTGMKSGYTSFVSDVIVLCRF